MNRVFEFSVKDYIYNIPVLLSDFTNRVADRCRMELSSVRMTDYERVVILSNDFYCEAGNSLKSHLFSFLKIPIMIVAEKDYGTYFQEQRDSFLQTLFVGIAPSEDTYSVFSILDHVRSNGGYVVCFTDLYYMNARCYADIVISTSHPTFHSYLPISDYVIAILSLISFGMILSEQDELVREAEINRMMRDVIDTASVITNSLHMVERQIAVCVSGIDNFDELHFAGSGMDGSAAYYCKYYMEYYLGRTSHLISTENWVKNMGQNISFVFTTRSNPAHSIVGNVITKSTCRGEICIITDDISICRNEKQNVIALPEVPDILKPILNIVVASLLVSKISERL